MCSTARSPAIPRSAATDRACALLTLGANLPIVGFHPEAKWFRNRLRRLAIAPDIDWVDVPVAPRHHEFLAVRSHRRSRHRARSASGATRQVVAISFRDLWDPGNFGRRRWRFFQAHFQFLMANERLGAAYDYYLICCGPLDLVTRATKPQQAVAAMAAQI